MLFFNFPYLTIAVDHLFTVFYSFTYVTAVTYLCYFLQYYIYFGHVQDLVANLQNICAWQYSEDHIN